MSLSLDSNDCSNYKKNAKRNNLHLGSDTLLSLSREEMLNLQDHSLRPRVTQALS